MLNKDEITEKKLQENARKKIHIIFERFGLSRKRKLGLQRAIRHELVQSALTGTILPK